MNVVFAAALGWPRRSQRAARKRMPRAGRLADRVGQDRAQQVVSLLARRASVAMSRTHRKPLSGVQSFFQLLLRLLFSSTPEPPRQTLQSAARSRIRDARPVGGSTATRSRPGIMPDPRGQQAATSPSAALRLQAATEAPEIGKRNAVRSRACPARHYGISSAPRRSADRSTPHRSRNALSSPANDAARPGSQKLAVPT